MTKALIRSKKFVHRLATLGGLLLWCIAAWAEQHTIPLFAAAGPPEAPQGVLRILNGADESGTVAIWAIDDVGARYGPATFTLRALAAAEFDAADLVSGNAAKGLSGGIGPLAGDLRLEIGTDLDIVSLAYSRAADGTLAGLHDTVPAAAVGESAGGLGSHRYEVPVFNPASEVERASRLRLVNPGDSAVAVVIDGRDDSGAAAPGGAVRLTLPPGGARTLTAFELEAGGAGLEGRLGAGAGRWRLTVTSDRPLQAVNVVAGAGGRFENLSTIAETHTAVDAETAPDWVAAQVSGAGHHAIGQTIPLFVASGGPTGPQGVLRIVNNASEAGTMAIHAIDDAGIRSGPATLTLKAGAAAEFTAAELASGSPARGLSGGVGPLAGDVRLEIESDLDIVALAYARAADGALSALHDTVPAKVVGATDGEAEGGTVSYRYEVPVFNPASDVSQASRLRLANPGDAPAAVTVEARDDGGAVAPGGVVRLTLPPGGARTLTALDLEAGGAGLTGRLGAGVGRWRLTVSSDRPLQAVNFAATGAGHIVNLSTAAAPVGFDLDSDNGRPEGVAWSGGRLHVVDAGDDKVFAYVADGARDAAADFDLDGENGNPTGIVWSGASFHVVDESDDKVYTYGTDGVREASSDFDLDADNGRPEGIVWFGGRFYVVDRSADKAFAYRADGSREASSDFDLDGENGSPSGIAWADGRFWVTDSSDDKVYVYGADGSRDASSDFDLNADNGNPSGIAWADGPFYVADSSDDKAYGYSGPARPGGGDGQGTTYGPGDTISTLPTGIWTPDAASNASVRNVAGITNIIFSYGGYVEVGGYRYTCQNLELCLVLAGEVDSGTIVQSPTTDTPPDTQPSFAAGSGPGDLNYTTGALIDALTLPAASGGEGELTYTLAPDVPGLSFDPAMRQLTGTPNAEGTYTMTYSATDSDGDTATLGFSIVVQASGGGGVAADFDLDGANGRVEGLAWTGERIYAVDSREDKVFAYSADGQRAAAFDFELDRDNGSPTGIALADGSFHVVDGTDDKVYAYTVDGQRQAMSDFDLDDANGRAEGIVWVAGRFYVVDRSADKVFAYRAGGGREAGSDFDLDGANGNPSAIAYSGGRFYVADATDDKVYAYGSDGGREAGSDFDLDEENGSPAGITSVNGRFHVVDSGDEKAYAYGTTGQAGAGGDDASPSFASGSGPGDLAYTVGIAIDALTLPEASGGDGTLTYALALDVPGLSFNAATRRLGGTPAAADTYSMTYTATDADGDAAMLGFSIEVAETAGYTGQQPGQTFSDGPGPEMVVIPAGSFWMGCTSGEWCHSNESPVHEVTIPHAFAVSKYEVTFEDWDACVADGGCRGHRPDDAGWGRDRRPVIDVLWEDAREYVAWLSHRTGAEYRLLTEAEWEYVARAGSQTAYSWGDDIGSNRANCGNYGEQDTCGDQWEYTAPVGSFPANAFGVHDMHGNVKEWVQDCWNYDYRGAPTDGSAWLHGAPEYCVYQDLSNVGIRVGRGGSWNSHWRDVRSASRSRSSGSTRTHDLGFRVARTLARPTFVTGTGVRNRTFTVGTVIGALTLPAASGGDGALTYALAPDVPGLNFDSATRQLSGTPTTADTYSMTYTVTDTDGDTSTLAFSIVVSPTPGNTDHQPGQIFTEGPGPEMVVVPAGQFQMGCVSGRECRSHEYPIHEVNISQAFAVSKYEVTFDEWDACVADGGCRGYSPDDAGWGKSRRPVINVSWDDAREYVAWLSERTGAQYRLLSEAEWEYVARAGIQTAYSWGNYIGSNRANCRDDGDGLVCGDQWEHTAPVGSFSANAFGVHDMHGNVSEWVEDCWNYDYAGAPSDGGVWVHGPPNYCMWRDIANRGLRVFRGGSYFDLPPSLRSASRSWTSPGSRDAVIGFRVARTLAP